MELFYELLLTAAVTLLAAFLLATVFAANDPRREPDRAATAIPEEAAVVVQEEKIIEVDEVKLSERRGAGVAAAAEEEEEAEGWIQVEKVPALVVEECLPEPDKEGVPVKAARAARLASGLEEEEGGVGEKRRDLTAVAAATRVVVAADPHALDAEAAPMEVVDVVGLEGGRMQDFGVKQRDLGADAAPSEVLNARSEKQGVEVVEVAEVLPLKSDDAFEVKEHHPVAEVLPLKSEAVEVKQRHLVAEASEALPLKTEAVDVKQHHVVAEAAPAEVLDAGLEEKSVQAIEVRPDELAAETAPEEILDMVLQKKEEQIVELKEQELAAEVAPQATLDVPLAEKEERKDQQPAEEAVAVHEEVQSREEVKCETHPVDQQEELIPEEELVMTKTDDVEVSHKDSSSDKVVTELPVDEVTLQGLPEDGAGADMDFGEWEGIERSEVEKRFGAAAAFAASDTGSAALSKLDSDVQLQLQGLLRVAIDGPCYDSTQPLTLRPSSRAKWVAWQKLGNMHPEIAMEKYMNLLSETIPGWLVNETSDTKKHEAVGYIEAPILTMTAATDQQSNEGNEDSTSIDEGRLTTSPNPEKGQSSVVPAE